MPTTVNAHTKERLIYQEIFIGTLIYAVVLGFFDDYTDIVEARSFSTIFLAAIVLQILTYLAFLLKKHIVRLLKDKYGAMYRILIVFFVWLVMFVSKFVFVWVIDAIFGDYITINGFFGILAIVLSVTIIYRVAEKYILIPGLKKS